jgi:hypothetical protein
VAALRCLYRRAVEDGLIAEADGPEPGMGETVRWQPVSPP